MISRARQLWKRLPAPLRGAFHKGVASIFDLSRGPQVWLNWRAGKAPGGPITVAGLFGVMSGVGEAARLFASALQGTDRPSLRLDVGAHFGGTTQSTNADDRVFGGTVVTFLNPPELLRWLPRGGAVALRHNRHVGFWFWELPEIPKKWLPAFRYVDEIWCQSHFTAEAIAKSAPERVPVRVLPHPIFTYGDTPPDRDYFCFPPGSCVVLTIFDFRSSAARKNPQGALAAFIAACPDPDPARAILICKMRGADAAPELSARLREAARERPDIRIVEQDMSETMMRRLVASVDVALSLHRAEGFGLLAAEAMWRGKAVVTTGWSGVLDFADDSSAALVDYKLVPVVDDQGIYAGGEWAEPDLEDATLQLSHLIDNPEYRSSLGSQARSKAQEFFDSTRWIRSVTERI